MRHSIPTQIDEICTHKACAPLLCHWLANSSEKQVSPHKRMDPLAFFKSLPDISIFTFDPDKNDYVLRLSGDNMTAIDNGKKGKTTIKNSYENPQVATEIVEKWNEARQKKSALITLRHVDFIGKRKNSIRLTLPMSEPESVITLALYEYDPVYTHLTKPRHYHEYENHFFSLSQLHDMLQFS